MVEYAYDYHINYVELDPAKATGERPDFCLEEQAPHIMFTPYLRELRDELAGDETNPIILARRFYDFVTTKVMYSYMREYFTLECIPEYCAVNQKGDCGVQALLFITLCRMSGIPARWQSGLYATEYDTGCHDWAQFYAAPYGWVYADLSFGGSAWRSGSIERWNYYLAIWISFVCRPTPKFRWNLCRRKNGCAVTRLTISAVNLNMRTMAFSIPSWMFIRNLYPWKRFKKMWGTR